MFWKNISLGLGVVLLLLVENTFAGGGAGRAAMVLFSSEPMEATTGIKMTQYLVADDFYVGASAEATTVSFKLGDWNGDFPAVFDGLIRWWIYLDDGGQPGQIMTRGTAYDVSYSLATPPGPSVYTSCYDLSFHLGRLVTLDPCSHYWLVLNLNQGLEYNEFYSWIKSETDYYSVARFSDGTPGWTPATVSLTFSVIADTYVQYLFADSFETGDSAIWSFSSLP